jgi:hypothetical protein
MLFDQFVKLTSDYWKKYMSGVSTLVARGTISASNGGKILFPTFLLCTETRHFFVAELIGASPTYNGLIVKRHKELSIDRYLNQFNEELPDPALSLYASENIQVTNMIIAQAADIEEVERRFPFVKFAETATVMRQGGSGSTIEFREDNKSASFFNCTLVNKHANAIRVKNILYMTVINKTFPKYKYLGELPQRIQWGDKLIGVRPVLGEAAESLIIASQFANIFLMNKLHETTIGEFLAAHPQLLKRALGIKRFVPEPYLPWVEKFPPNTDEAINPDLLIEREDGFYDIYDLKTAVLDRTSITKGKRARRRFIDYVNEGIAQLANYEEYFAFPKNQQLAWEKYQVKVNDPKLVLVVGSFENADRDEIDEASRALRNLTIIDYDTLMQLFISSRNG